MSSEKTLVRRAESVPRLSGHQQTCPDYEGPEPHL